MRQYLINKLNSVQDAGIRERNQAEANKITMARTNIDRTTGDVLISIQRVENGRTQNLRLAGTLTAEGIAQLSPISSAVAVKGSLICLDQDSRTCYTTRVRLEFGRPGHRGVVNIINRRTLANFDFHLPAEISRNLEFRKFLSLFMNTERRNGSYNSLREIMVDSFEVMNGRSGIKFSLISYENELIVAEGPLLAPANGGIATNIIMRRDPYLDDLVDLETRRGFKSNIHNSLSDVRLITNDGTRKFTLFMNVRPDEFNDQGSLSITFVRLHRGIMSMPQFQDLEKREQQ